MSAEAVSLAIGEGRLTAGVVRAADGSPKIGDVAAADLEWQPQADRRRGGLDPALAADLAAARLERDRAEAERARTLAEMARMDLDERRGKLVDLAEIREAVGNDYAIVKNHMLAVPSKLGQRLSHDVAQLVCPLVDELIRAALHQLADGGPFRAARASATTEDEA